MADDGIIYVKPEDFPKVPLVLDVISPRFIRENKIIPVELKNNVRPPLSSSSTCSFQGPLKTGRVTSTQNPL